MVFHLIKNLPCCTSAASIEASVVSSVASGAITVPVTAGEDAMLEFNEGDGEPEKSNKIFY